MVDLPDKPIDRLIEIMRRLRAPDGCPWDREQTLQTLRKYLIEETYEVLDAIDRDDVADHVDELGDLLLQIVFQSQLREEEGTFDFDAVATAISDKMIRRHPHVFGEASADTSEEVLQNWEAIKAAERRESGKEQESALDGVPMAMPALVRAERLQKRAARIGFDWNEAAPVFEKLMEEVDELREAVEGDNPEEVMDELGDLLFSAVNLARFSGHDPEEVMRHANDKFEKRFRAMEQCMRMAGRNPEDLTLDEMEEYWQEAKSSQNAGGDIQGDAGGPVIDS